MAATNIFEIVSENTGAFIKKSNRKRSSDNLKNDVPNIPIPKLYDSLVKIAESRSIPQIYSTKRQLHMNKARKTDVIASEKESNNEQNGESNDISNEKNEILVEDDIDNNIDLELRKGKPESEEISIKNAESNSPKPFEKLINSMAEKPIRERKRRLPQSSANRDPAARKKKSCPICKLSFANLTTHKKTHLSPEEVPFKCDVCMKGFTRKFDFLRHKKEHVQRAVLQNTNSNMTEAEKLTELHNAGNIFRCPYNKQIIDLDLSLYSYKVVSNKEMVTKCHRTGVFLRKDTLRNHLRNRHFEYDQKDLDKSQKLTASGRCKICNKWHESAKIWSDEHVGSECGYHFH